MAQLRREDVAKTSEGIWYLNITPEAGSQKDEPRDKYPYTLTSLSKDFWTP